MAPRKNAKAVRADIIRAVVPEVRRVLLEDHYKNLATKKLAVGSTGRMFNKNYEPKFPASKRFSTKGFTGVSPGGYHYVNGKRVSAKK